MAEIFPPPQVMPFSGKERQLSIIRTFACSRVRVRAGHDRPEPHHRGFHQEAARAGQAIKRAATRPASYIVK